MNRSQLDGDVPSYQVRIPHHPEAFGSRLRGRDRAGDKEDEQVARLTIFIVAPVGSWSLSIESGLRLMVTHLYAWKSCKRIRSLIFMEADKAGYWEQHGYHMRGDPFREERFR